MADKKRPIEATIVLRDGVPKLKLFGDEQTFDIKVDELYYISHTNAKINDWKQIQYKGNNYFRKGGEPTQVYFSSSSPETLKAVKVWVVEEAQPDGSKKLVPADKSK